MIAALSAHGTVVSINVAFCASLYAGLICNALLCITRPNAAAVPPVTVIAKDLLPIKSSGKSTVNNGVDTCAISREIVGIGPATVGIVPLKTVMPSNVALIVTGVSPYPVP